MHLSNVSMQMSVDQNVSSDNGKEFSSASMAYIADQLGFTKVYTAPYSPHLNSVIERCHNFLKNSIRKLRSNH